MTMRADGRVTQTTSIPGTGISFQQTRGTARKASTSSSSSGLGCMVVIGFIGIVLVLEQCGQSYGGPGVIMAVLAIAGGVAGFVFMRHRAREQEAANERAAWEQHVDRLIAAYGAEAAKLIVAGDPWQGATQPMIREMLGAPADVATKVQKTKTVETWKYHPITKTRYALKITFENGLCTGWEKS